MVTVIFEVMPHTDSKQEYLDIAASLLPVLQEQEGFISIERFQSLSNPEKILSLSFWETEEAVKNRRNTELHRAAQKKGRESVFANYRLRVGSIIRDYGLQQRDEAPEDSIRIHG